jgi:hypothetical protein
MAILEAEYIARSECSRQAKWLLELQQDIHGKDPSPLLINCDNEDGLSHIRKGIIKARMKHSDVYYLKIRGLPGCKTVDYYYVHMEENVEDILTKALSKYMQEKFTKAIGLWYYRST